MAHFANGSSQKQGKVIEKRLSGKAGGQFRNQQKHGIYIHISVYFVKQPRS
jgi:hypothetical protein